MGFAYVATVRWCAAATRRPRFSCGASSSRAIARAADRLLEARLAESHAAAARASEGGEGAPKTMSELASRATGSLLPVGRLVRRATTDE